MRNKFIHYSLVMAWMLLFCVPCVTVTYAQSFTVTGTVTDSQGGIPGANVKVKGGTAGTITNMDGQFTLSVPLPSLSWWFHTSDTPHRKLPSTVKTNWIFTCWKIQRH